MLLANFANKYFYASKTTAELFRHHPFETFANISFSLCVLNCIPRNALVYYYSSNYLTVIAYCAFLIHCFGTLNGPGNANTFVMFMYVSHFKLKAFCRYIYNFQFKGYTPLISDYHVMGVHIRAL